MAPLERAGEDKAYHTGTNLPRLPPSHGAAPLPLEAQERLNKFNKALKDDILCFSLMTLFQCFVQRYLQHTGQLAAQQAIFYHLLRLGVFAFTPSMRYILNSMWWMLARCHGCHCSRRQAPVSFKLVIAGGSTSLWSRTELRQKEQRQKK